MYHITYYTHIRLYICIFKREKKKKKKNSFTIQNKNIMNKYMFFIIKRMMKHVLNIFHIGCVINLLYIYIYQI